MFPAEVMYMFEHYSHDELKQMFSEPRITFLQMVAACAASSVIIGLGAFSLSFITKLF